MQRKIHWAERSAEENKEIKRYAFANHAHPELPTVCGIDIGHKFVTQDRDAVTCSRCVGGKQYLAYIKKKK